MAARSMKFIESLIKNPFFDLNVVGWGGNT
jgi:hypothetical protein